ncbi:hypothetical protein CONPUDRAFT_122373 [Coniophora puteana RWD-64-598 SS2]|uniref:DUF6589 domain-containing protein n=1 Tax=Coniophora puteana (strain RWD-64-598) TaxID=741705 RepID=A0A5M3MRZ8_CONPW|nr:uncharacterized protein CONPUDRAFT_122373 [Coniophora puteana RWD-64-598 SS2]EIW81866.1 hypothetical protein CONPUDRAFT_122373 [Coniophora puteana RWD-64-598 SS2]
MDTGDDSFDFNPRSFDFDSDISPFDGIQFTYQQLNAADDSDEDDSEDELGGSKHSESPLFLPTVNTADLGSSLAQRAAACLYYMASQGFDLPGFLSCVSWGDAGCIQHPAIRGARTALMNSDKLPGILKNWWMPNRPSGSTKKRPRAARGVMEAFGFEVVTATLEKELEEISDMTLCPSDELSADGLTSFTIDEWKVRLSSPGIGGTPRLWSLLYGLSRTHQQESRDVQRQPDMMVVATIMQIMYSRSQSHNKWQKMLTTHLRSQNIGAKSLDLLHSLGITMSHKWMSRAIKTISENTLAEVRKRIEEGEDFTITHDNLNLAFKVFNQRINNQTHFDSGTSATAYFQPDAPPQLPPLSNRTFQEFRQEARRQGPLSIQDIFNLDREAAAPRRQRDMHRILSFLFSSTDFEYKTYSGREHSLLSKPPPVQQLSTGPQYRTEKQILGTVHIEEASYKGNEKVIDHFLRILGLANTNEKQRQMGMDRVIVWGGDQLTAERLRGLIARHAWDDNSFDRLDFLVPVFGWFHNSMTFAASLHKQYLGTCAGRGLRHSFTILNRKGLDSVKTRGSFHQQLDEAIVHITEARFWDCWRVVTGVDDLAELRDKSPERLCEFAEEILDKLASTSVIEDWDLRDDEDKDEIFRESVLWNCDALRYIDLHTAIKGGDVGVMEATLPYLLFRYAGGGNSRYAIEILELLHCIHREWPPELKDFVQRRAWLVNLTGQPGKWHPVDQAQEHNIKDQKVTYSMDGPSASWEGMNKIGPAVSTLVKVRRHMEKQIRTLRRGVTHSKPSKTEDVKRLENTFRSSRVNENKGGRTAPTPSDRVVDVVGEGAIHLFRRKTIARWWENRNLRRKTTEIWD